MKLIPVDTKGESRLRTYMDCEINLMFTMIKDAKEYVSHKFKSEVRRLGIKNARFHDLRRTFGLNLIKQGMSIYKVSRLLGFRIDRWRFD